MFKRFRARARERLAGITLLLLVSLLGAFAVAAPAWASNATVVIPFEKHWVEPGHYLGSACDGGTIEMFVSDSSVTGGVQHFTATLNLSVGTRSLTAILHGDFTFSTGRVVLNGVVVDGWLKGAQVHEESRYTGDDQNTGGPIFTGTVQLMPGSAD